MFSTMSAVSSPAPVPTVISRSASVTPASSHVPGSRLRPRQTRFRPRILFRYGYRAPAVTTGAEPPPLRTAARGPG
ncbi:hypothetical protein GCM10023107_29850 [Actinoplanes octamycinicus]|nr:hypothetical protein Aoc01nite_45530 [Actinoplanes octamycinicus]